MYVLTRAAKKRIMDAIRAGGAPFAAELNGGDLELYTDVASPISELSVAADFTVPTFAGYAAKTIAAFGVTYLGADGEYHVEGPSQQWTGPADASGQDVVGWFFLNAAGLLVAAGAFDEGPQPMFTVDDAIVLSTDNMGMLGGEVNLLSA